MFLLQVLPLSSPDRDTVYRVSSLSKILSPNGSLLGVKMFGSQYGKVLLYSNAKYMEIHIVNINKNL